MAKWRNLNGNINEQIRYEATDKNSFMLCQLYEQYEVGFFNLQKVMESILNGDDNYCKQFYFFCAVIIRYEFTCNRIHRPGNHCKKNWMHKTPTWNANKTLINLFESN